MSYAYASQIRSDYIASLWRQLNPVQKISVSAAFAGAVIGIPWLVYSSFLSLDAQLSGWNEDYKSACYSYDPESELNNNNSYGGGTVKNMKRSLNGSYLGQKITAKFADEEMIICTGATEDPENTVEFWRMHDVVIVNEQATAAQIISSLTSVYTGRADDQISSWSADYTPEDGLFWHRAKIANYYVVYIDSMYQQGGGFAETAEWRHVLDNPKLRPYAELYQRIIEQEKETYVIDRKNPRLAVFEAIMGSDLVLQSEEKFLTWYRSELDDVSRQEPYPCLDYEGNPSTCSKTVWDPPPRRRNSTNLAPETLTAMTSAFFEKGDGYMNADDAAKLINNPGYSMPKTQEGQTRWTDIAARIKRCCNKNRNASYADNGLDSTELRF